MQVESSSSPAVEAKVKLELVNSTKPEDDHQTQGQDSVGPLEADIQTARSSLNTCLLQLGLILRFHRDVRSLGVEDYATRAPQALTKAMQASLAAYESACDNMERQLMRARAIALKELEPVPVATAVSTTSTTESAAAETGSTPAVKQEADEPASTIDLTESPSCQKPVEASRVAPSGEAEQQKAIIIDDDEMEDLFGPGTAKTVETADPGSTGSSTGGTAVLPVVQPAGDSVEEALTAGSLFGVENDNTPTANPLLPGVTGSELPDIPSTAPLAFGDTASGMNTDMPVEGLGMALDPLAVMPPLPSQADLDFSSMSSTDFGALLAGLGGGGGLGDLSGGLNLDMGSLLGGTGASSTGTGNSNQNDG